MSHIVIASRLSDGRVVFLSEVKGKRGVVWKALIEDASLAADDSRGAELLDLGEADANEHHEVVDPYLIDVEEIDGGFRPTKYREVIRCLGPTNRLDLGKQSEGAQA